MICSDVNSFLKKFKPQGSKKSKSMKWLNLFSRQLKFINSAAIDLMKNPQSDTGWCTENIRACHFFIDSHLVSFEGTLCTSTRSSLFWITRPSLSSKFVDDASWREWSFWDSVKLSGGNSFTLSSKQSIFSSSNALFSSTQTSGSEERAWSWPFARASTTSLQDPSSVFLLSSDLQSFETPLTKNK